MESNKMYFVSNPDGASSISLSDMYFDNTKYPIGDIVIDGRVFDPQPGMSPIESAWIAALFVHATSGWRSYDFKEFIHKHKLDRHFREK